MVMYAPPPTEKQKAYARRKNGIRIRFGIDLPAPAFKATREFLAPMSSNYVPCKLRGRSGTRLSASKRSMVVSRREKRAAFFESLGTGE